MRARRRSTAVGVSLSAAVRERNLVPLSADAFLEDVEGASEDASGIVAATLGSLASSAAFEGLSLDVKSGSEALGTGVAGDRDVMALVTRGSFCDLGEAGDDGDRVAQAGSTLAVSVLLRREVSFNA